jgi:membrane-associated phospholipid phosphatase
MDLYLFRDYIGLYAPIILFIFTIFLLRNMKTFLSVFVAGFLFNNLLNIVLKLLIKEPRPSKDQKAIEIGVVNGARIGFDKFGMPSGHAQNGGFCFTFITMVLNNPFVSTLFLIISVISLFQRYLYNNHTILQLGVGFIVGSIVALFAYRIANQYIVGSTQIKKDEYGPI